MDRKPITILIAEDDEDDIFLINEAFEESKLSNQVVFVNNGIELLDYLRRENEYSDENKYPKPDIILLDLNMPKMDGREALKIMKSDPEIRSIPVTVLTTSKADADIIESYNLGVNSYITKPVTFEKLVEITSTFAQYWVEIVKLPK